MQKPNINNFKFFSVVFLISLIFLFSCSKIFIKKSQKEVTPHAMVAAAHPIASQVGMDILKKGGNAVDAALAIAFALSIAEPNASGIGGGGFLMIKMTDQKEPVMIDYREIAPGKATAAYYYQNDSSFYEYTHGGEKSIGVPGLVACAELALPKYGSMSLKEILSPAIKLANDGIVVSEKLNGMIVDNFEKIMNYEATSKIYLSDMMPLESGSKLTNRNLANTFSKITENGGSVFYEGEIAEAIATEVKNQGGFISLSDLKKYQAKIRKPIIGNYRGYQIISTAPPSAGMFLIELLNMMERYDVRSLGHNSAQFIHFFTEAMKIMYADKTVNAADPDFYNVPVEYFTDKKYARGKQKLINPNKAGFEYSSKTVTTRESNDTSHLSIVDEKGNIVALTQSINHWFGSGLVVPGTGILLNDHLGDFNDLPGFPNSIEPHKRPASNTAPTIILKNGKSFMTLGSPGGTRIISALAQIIMNVIDFNMSMDQAIEAPRLHCLKNILHLEGRIEENIVGELEKMGHKLKIHPDFDNFFGGAQGIIIQKEGTLDGGADSRRDGVAIGY
ncbi:gamma-glutamyltransferase [candidate division KSB1 bacterium]|nr:gamma-glutamyltransferase [candidate division KSB1 bacterium]